MTGGQSVQRSRFLLAASLLLVFSSGDCALAQSPPDEEPEQLTAGVQDLYLEVFVNGEPVQMVAAARKDAAGQISMPADQLRGVGILPRLGDPRSEERRVGKGWRWPCGPDG